MARARPHRPAVQRAVPVTDTVTMMKRDRRVYVQIVVCPTCGAAVGAPCTKVDGGNPLHKSHHIARRRMALRAERGEA